MKEEPCSRAGDLPPIRNLCGTIARRIIIVAQAGPVPEYLSALVCAAGDSAVILSELDIVLRHIKDPADIVIVAVPVWQSEEIDVVAKTRAAVPTVPVIVISGCSREDLYLHVPASEDDSRFLAQPFTPEALRVALDSAFDRRSARSSTRTAITSPNHTATQP